MPYDFAIRITRSYDDFKQVISRWSLECDKMVVYEHIGTRTQKVHIHLAIQNSRICREQLRNIANDIVTVRLKGQGDWSFKVWDGSEQYLVYCTKGKHDPSFNKGFDEEYLNSCKKKFVTPVIVNKLERHYISVFGDNGYLKDSYNMRYEGVEDDKRPSFIKYVRAMCRNASMDMNNTRMITPKVVADATTFFRTYCFENKIRIENEKDPMYKHINLF